MPFSAAGVYTPPTGAENATPGAVIRSSTWNTIFTDISTALTQLAQGTFLPTPRIITSAASFTVAAADSVILVKAAVPTITLPLSSTKTGSVKIFGAAAGIFGSNNSVVVPSGGDTISGLGSHTLAANYQVVTYYPLSSGGYLID